MVFMAEHNASPYKFRKMCSQILRGGSLLCVQEFDETLTFMFRHF